MKHLLFSLIAGTAMILSACSDISTDDRFIATESVAPQRAVIIEDFTGQNCVNCPSAHETLDLLVEQYGDAVIPVSIHAGTFGVASDYTRYTGLMQPEGNTYNDAWNITEWPKGVVNRHGAPSNASDWAALVRTEIARPTTLAIDLEAGLSDDESTVTATVVLKPTANITGKLQVWILEDGIVAFQKDDERGRIPDYVHNHVYRASVNGVGGEAVVLQSMIHKTLTFSIPVRDTEHEHWNAHNLSVVAFVYDDSEVLQAAKAHVWTDPDSETTN